MDKRNILLTEDGSNTVFSTKFNSLYHSSHGAMQESRHIFIENGLKHFFEKNKPSKINILEYGFGTGLNAYLTMHFAEKNNIIVDYCGLEGYPLRADEVKKLNYTSYESLRYLNNEFLMMHHNEKIYGMKLTNYFIFSKQKILFEEYQSDKKYDIIYYDVFGAEVQAVLWLRPFLDKVVANLKQNGILITYGAKGTFKRALKSLDMDIQNIPGPPGKREITRALNVK